jgi:hypothetical protein
MNRTDLLKISLELSDLALLDLGARMTVNEDDSIDIHLDREKGDFFIELLEGIMQKFVLEGRLQPVPPTEKHGRYRVRGLEALKEDITRRGEALLSGESEEPPTLRINMGLN